jgi:formylglycine-generating enzyme required for sulfatase activity
MRFVVGLGILACSVGAALLLTSKQSSRAPRSWSAIAPGASSSSSTTSIPSAPLAAPAPGVVETVLPEPHQWSHALCPIDMVWVGGSYCAKPRRVGDAAIECVSGERRVAVCVDPHEYPNQSGTLPAVMLDFKTATAACEAEGKRLCTESEWTFACESTREVSACNTGRTDLSIRTRELAMPERIGVEIAAHEGRRRSGENACVDDFRVFDLLGNVQEWVTSEHRTPHVGALKGGRYNQSSIGCDRSIYVSDPWTRYPHTGLRCCADPLAAAPTSP